MMPSSGPTARRLALSAALVACAALACATSAAIAQAPFDPAAPDLDLRHGALLFHGNYCGPGNRGPHAPPVDALDLACKHHDACTPSGALSSCACNARLEAEAARVANDPREPPDLQDLAGLVAVGATALPCRPAGAVIRY